jgi:urease accessory protein
VVAEPGPHGGTRLAVLRSQAPLMLRPTAAALYLAASAAGPLGGDVLELSVTVRAGARLVLRTVSAAVALPGCEESSFAWWLSVEAGGRLAVLPEPTIVAAGARHRAVTRARVEAGGALVLREEVLLGRYGEPGGTYRGSVHADLGGEPLLRSELVLDGSDPVTAGPASAVGDRATGSLLVVDPAGTGSAGMGPHGTGSAVMPLAGPGLLVSAAGPDARTLRARLDAELPGWLAP